MINWVNQRVLLVSAHRDDVELGAGGTMHKINKIAECVCHVSFSDPPGVIETEFKQEHRRSMDKLFTRGCQTQIIEHNENPRFLPDKRGQILDTLFKLNQKFRPTIVFTHCSTDIHQSHQTIYEECCRAFKYCTLLGYEMPWNNYEFRPGLFSILGKKDHDAKIAAIACYKSQQRRTFFSNGVVGDLMRVRGKQVNHEYAEAFEVIRMFV